MLPGLGTLQPSEIAKFSVVLVFSHIISLNHDRMKTFSTGVQMCIRDSIGVNTFTLDGDEAAISEAKDVLAKKGATYQNVYFDSDGEAGKFTTNIFAYPTTYVVDRNGNIVGEPIVGAITEEKQAETLQKLIDQALAADMG